MYARFNVLEKKVQTVEDVSLTAANSSRVTEAEVHVIKTILSNTYGGCHRIVETRPYCQIFSLLLLFLSLQRLVVQLHVRIWQTGKKGLFLIMKTFIS